LFQNGKNESLPAFSLFMEMQSKMGYLSLYPVRNYPGMQQTQVQLYSEASS